jgi:hypothetical protein
MQCLEHRSFCGDLYSRGWVFDRPEVLDEWLVIDARLDCERSLPDCRQAGFRRKHRVRGVVQQPRAGEAGRCEHDRVTLAFTELSNACLDVASQGHEVKIGALSQELYDTAP